MNKKMHCPKCNTKSLAHIKTTKEPAGTLRKELYSRGLAWGKVELIRETNYYKCTTCGNETQLESTSAE